ncbi:MAG TPA: non-homologous end-joining DNA ligase, partial [Cyclobacteriaceae bacterium]|nr:non-homologous end-joining DNA ligase [Cyclobacteriaceae bacterium]
KGDDYIFEVKWDGIRALIAVEDGQIRIRSRNQNDITAQFPELLVPDKAFRANCALFDVEIVCLDKTGRPQFKSVINRLMSTGETNIQKLSKSNPAFCYIFDCLYMDGRSLVNEPLLKRKEWLKDSVKPDTPYRVSEFVEDGESLFEAAREHSLEGIMAKRKDGKYISGRRSDLWLKVKVRNSAECCVIGYTQGKGNRSQTFGSLQVAEKVGDDLWYRGKVGTGFDDALMKEIFQALKKQKQVKKQPVLKGGKVADEKVTQWIEPYLVAEVSYSKLTPDKIFREPVFVRMRPDIQLSL